jgi:DNA-directed RNA polymerase specialized sigma24 family protein
MMMDQLSDNHEEIFKELLAENVDRYFPAFARTYEASLRSYIAGMGAHSSDVDDIAHEALVRIRFWLKDSYPQKIRTSNLKTYLYRIAENCVRVKQREYRMRSDWSPFQDFLITEADIFDELIDSEL